MVDVKVGDTVMVCTDYGSHEAREAREGIVISITISTARVWCEISTGIIAHRFRLDTQMGDSHYGFSSRFYTMEQWERREREGKASAWLCGQGLSIEPGSPWRDRIVDLVETIKKTEG